MTPAQIALTQMMITHHPGLVGADPRACAAACMDMATALGAILGHIHGAQGQAAFEGAAKIVFQKIADCAVSEKGAIPGIGVVQ